PAEAVEPELARAVRAAQPARGALGVLAERELVVGVHPRVRIASAPRAPAHEVRDDRLEGVEDQLEVGGLGRGPVHERGKLGLRLAQEAEEALAPVPLLLLREAEGLAPASLREARADLAPSGGNAARIEEPR